MDVSGPSRSPQAVELKAAHILLVEDHDFIRGLFEKELEQAGYRVTVTTDGAEGLKEVQLDGFDLVVSNYRMPRMNGIELLEHVWGREKVSHLPFLLVTADPVPALRRKLKEANAALHGRAEIMGKDEGPEALRGAVQRLLQS